MLVTCKVIYCLSHSASFKSLGMSFLLLHNRWKKMEHHDIMAECGRFTLDRCREEILGIVNSRCTPPPGRYC